MSDQVRDNENDDVLPLVGGRRRKRRGAKGCLAVLVALAVIVGGFYFAISKGVDILKDKFGSAEDFGGPGHGKVIIQVESGDVASQICRDLKGQGVVASVDACIGAANANPKAGGIQVGSYELQKEMAAADAIAQTVRLIRSKGVGVFFITQTPKDVDEDVLAAMWRGDWTPFEATLREKLLQASLGVPFVSFV